MLWYLHSVLSFLARSPILIGYLSLIIQAFSQCHKGRSVIYDRRFSLKASAVAITEWSNIDITVWKLAFYDRLPSGGTHCLTKSPAQTKTSFSRFSSSRPRPVCLEWNETTSTDCSRPSCRYEHSCYRCIHLNILSKNHEAIFCPQKDKLSRGQTSISGKASRAPKITPVIETLTCISYNLSSYKRHTQTNDCQFKVYGLTYSISHSASMMADIIQATFIVQPQSKWICQWNSHLASVELTT